MLRLRPSLTSSCFKWVGTPWKQSLVCVSKRSYTADDAQCLPCGGTVKEYHRHVMLVTRLPKYRWPPKVELLSTVDPLHHAIQAAKQTSQLKGKTKISLIRRYSRDEAQKDTDHAVDDNQTLLIYPGAIELFNTEPSQVSNILASQLESRSNGSISAKKDVLVCVHGNKDLRCQKYGVEVLHMLAEAIVEKDDVRLWESSHIGGHAYAGNVVIYPEGDWYGNVRSEADVREIVGAHLSSNATHEPVWRLWRGRIGLSKEQQVDELLQHGH